MNLAQAEKYVSSAHDIDAYIEAHAGPEPPYLAHIARQTHLYTVYPRMMAGRLEGRLLKMLVQITSSRRVLELGTFTGYSACCLAEGLGEEGTVTTIEKNDEMEQLILENLAQTPFSGRIRLMIGDALEIMPRLEGPFDLIFIDADKRLYPEYLELSVRLSRPGTLILADNTLWDGKILNPEPNPGDLKTRTLQAFNRAVADDARFESLILPLRDGLTLIRVK